jgi:hypothetical protein
MQIREANSGIESGDVRDRNSNRPSLPEIEALCESWMAWSSHRDSNIDFT